MVKRAMMCICCCLQYETLCCGMYDYWIIKPSLHSKIHSVKEMKASATAAWRSEYCKRDSHNITDCKGNMKWFSLLFLFPY